MTYELTITKIHEWDMAHRLGDGYKSKCKHLHGHRYKLEITIGCAKLDPYGMVQDFGTIKQVLGGWIDQHLDHACVVSKKDKELLDFVRDEGQRFHPVSFNTTVEHLVVWLAETLQCVLNQHVMAQVTEEDAKRAENLEIAHESCQNYVHGGPIDKAAISAERKRQGRAITKAKPNFVLRGKGRALTITHLRLYETPNGYADWNKPE